VKDLLTCTKQRASIQLEWLFLHMKVIKFLVLSGLGTFLIFHVVPINDETSSFNLENLLNLELQLRKDEDERIDGKRKANEKCK